MTFSALATSVFNKSCASEGVGISNSIFATTIQSATKDSVFKANNSKEDNKFSVIDDNAAKSNDNASSSSMEQCNSPVSNNGGDSLARFNEIKIKNQRKAIAGLNSSILRHQFEIGGLQRQLKEAEEDKEKLKEELSKYQKLQQLLAANIFQSDPKNEDLLNLLRLDISDLFSKYKKQEKTDKKTLGEVKP